MAKLYDSKAEYYDALYNEKDYEGEVEFILSQFSEKAESDGNKVLVIGCGTGNHTKFLEEKGFDVLATDPHEGALEVAKTKSDAEFRQASAPNLDIEGSFDIVLLPFGVTSYLDQEEIEETFREIKDLLKTGGILFFDNCNYRVKDGDTSETYFEAYETAETGIARTGQNRKLSEHKTKMESIIFATQENESFIDNHILITHEDQDLKDLLTELEFKVYLFEDGFGTDSPKDHGTGFIAVNQ